MQKPDTHTWCRCLDQFHVDELEVSGSFCPFTQGRYYRTLSGTTAASLAVLPLRPVLVTFGTDVLQFAPGVTQHYRALPVVPCGRYYRTVSGTTALPHAVLPLRPVLQDFGTDVFQIGSWCRPALPGPPGSTGRSVLPCPVR